MECGRRAHPCERLRGFDGDSGTALLQNTTFAHVCFKLLMLLHKAGHPPVGVQEF